MIKTLTGWLLASCAFYLVHAEDTEPIKTYTTAKVIGEAPVIDGLLDDKVWEQVPWGGDFIGYQPEYKATPSEPTQFKILYDDKYLYVGIRAFDSDPSKIAKRMSRRDGFEGDYVEINIDSYHDKRTAFSFSASVSGVKGDEYVTNNGDNWDSTWDPIWYLKTSIDDKGWIAEFKIPLSQLRFPEQPELTWGIQLTRRFFRNDEESTWQPISQNAPGWVHLFGELKGIKGIKPQKQLEVQPYVVSQVAKYKSIEGHPYIDGTDMDANIGVDVKIGITSNTTLDLTINPDFGQVEADPSVVNLSAFEQFFRERRPFFLEGNNLFDFRLSGGRNNLFYSRRIGASAHGRVSAGDIRYTDRTSPTRILAAAKMTGKNARGFSWGVVESVTGRVSVNVTDTLGIERKEKIEPYTNYFAGRMLQDINEGNTVIGAFFTNMNRFGNNVNGLENLHDNAQSAGIDIRHNMLDRKYRLNFSFSGSRVSGSEASLYRTQTSLVRNYQRTDNLHREVDTSLTVLHGTSGSLQFGKRSGDWRWDLGTNYRSPGLATNDIGFLSQTDIINLWGWTQYRKLKPKGIFRSQRYSLHVERYYDFGGVNTNQVFNFRANLEFKNYWNFGTRAGINKHQISNADLRGGPSIRYPVNGHWRGWMSTNQQKKVSFSINTGLNWAVENSIARKSLRLGITLQPTDALRISINPSISTSRFDLQYVNTLEVAGEPLYLLGTVRQITYRMSMRANYNITPNLTLEFWGQPFIAKGEYNEYKEVLNATDEVYSNRYALLGDAVRIPTDAEIADFVATSDDFDSPGDFPSDGVYGLFRTDNAKMDTYFYDPDFNLVQFRSNFVLRWEYVPGSTLFLVWSNNGSYFDQSEDNSFRSLKSKLGELDGENTFLLKFTYRFIL